MGSKNVLVQRRRASNIDATEIIMGKIFVKHVSFFVVKNKNIGLWYRLDAINVLKSLYDQAVTNFDT